MAHSAQPARSDGPAAPDEARTEILRRINAALVNAPSPVEITRNYQTAGTSGGDIVGLFMERVADYKASVQRTTERDLPVAIAAALARRSVLRLVAPAGLPEAWLSQAPVERLHDSPPLSVPDLDAADGVITGCSVAIAVTGTIVLDAGPGEGRRALSLLPDYHLCIVRADQIVASVPEAIARLDPVRPQTWISGPSATSDIELQRIEGVHGPRVLDVIVVG